MRIRTSVTGCAFLAVVVGLVPSQQSFADVVVDFSPDTKGTNVPFHPCFSNSQVTSYFGDTFTLSVATTIRGGSVFSCDNVGFVGDPVRFVILPDVAGLPGPDPCVDVFRTLDVVDTTLTPPISNLTRKHASIPPVVLPAGTYWFYMTGDGAEIGQATGLYDDNSLAAGDDLNPDLELQFSGLGDVFFTLDGSASTCPWDLNGNGFVWISDLLILFHDFGSCDGSCDGSPADFDGDGCVTFHDLIELLHNLGHCP